MNDIVVFAGFAGGLALILVVLLRRGKAVRSNRSVKARKLRIIVDGSNVMHWGGEPSLSVLIRVVKDLQSRGYAPLVICDASAGYRLDGHFVGSEGMAAKLGLSAGDVRVVDKGIVADGVILELARDSGCKVVSNDRYRDWGLRFPLVKQRGRIMRGDWKQGAVIWR